MNGQNISTNNDIQTSTRRTFVKGFAWGASALAASAFGFYKFFRNPSEKKYSGSIQGASAKFGHLIRSGQLPEPTEHDDIGTVIVGGGISGLSAAWWLNKRGYHDFVLLELEANVGGNSQSGKNHVSSYPWGAHYLPLPGATATHVRQVLEELEVITGYDHNGLPIYNEYYLCADPHERLFIQGRWQEGIVPQIGLSDDDRRQYDQFFSLIEKYKSAKGRDGKNMFEIPVDFSSQDPEFLALDRITMAEFIRSKGWNSKYLNWYVNYCCRDDYGMTQDNVSAWAGLHYFASRGGHGANADSQTVLTWPEGNGWLVKRIQEKVQSKIQSNSLVFSVNNAISGASVDYLDTETGKTKRLNARNVIFAAPRFVGMRVIKNLSESNPAYRGDLHYAPWVVANISLSSLPSGNGAPLSWDNVSFYSESLGYVVATHQSLTSFPKQSVITYYLPLSNKDPSLARIEASLKSHEDWARQIAADLERMHPGISDAIDNIDVWIWGHGMIGPKVGFVWGDSRKQMLSSMGNIHFAHSDMSGISIFEEAQYRGIVAANKIINHISQSGRLQ